MADEQGLDTVLAAPGDLGARARAALRARPLIRAKVAAGELGKKTGQGFLEYT